MRFNLKVPGFLALILVAVVTPAQNVVSTIVGGAATGPGDGGSASLAFLNKPTGVTCVGSPCSLIIVDQSDQRIRKVDTKGLISTIAGTGIAGYQDGPAAQAQFNFPESAKVDANGNIYVTEVLGHTVRKIDTAGNVTTIAGISGKDGDSGDGCPATAATFHQLYGVAIDAGGNVYVSDSQASRVRRITTSGCIATILGNGTAGFAGDGTANGTLNSPQGLAYDSNADVLYVADTSNHRIRMLTKASAGGGLVNTFAGCGTPGTSGCSNSISTSTTATKATLFLPQDVAVGPDGIYILDVVQLPGGFSTLIYRVDNTGTMTLLYSLSSSSNSAGFLGSALTVVSQTQIYVSEVLYTRTIQLLNGNPSGSQTYAGGGLLDGVPAVTAGVIGPVATCPLNPSVPCMPAGIRTDSLGNIYISDFGENRVRKIDTSGNITTVAGNGILASRGDGGSALLASLAGPLGLDFDGAGNLYIAESFGNRVRMVSAATGNISTFAGTGGVVGCSQTSGPCGGDGGPATSATIANPTSVAVNRSTGAVYIVDNGNDRIRVVNSGVISTYAGTAVGTLCNGGSLSCGDGGPATSAELAGPVDIVLDGSGNLYIAERFVQVSLTIAYAGARIRKVDTSGKISTIAGNGLFDGSGEGSAALSASLGTPSGLAIDPNNGNLYVSDDRNQRILRVTGTVTRLVGNGASGFNGDGAAPINTQIQRPQGLALDAGGNLLFWDTGNNRIRKVPGIGTANPETMLASSGNHQTANVTQPPQPLPNKLSVVVLNGSSPVSGVVVQFTVSPANAATLNPTSAVTDASGTASTQVALGTVGGTFTIMATATGLPVVTFNETALPAIPAGSAVEGASFAAIPLAPGTITSLFGTGLAGFTASALGVPLPYTLPSTSGASVTVIGSKAPLSAPLFFVSPGQINFQLPFEVTDPTVNLVVNTGGVTSAPLLLNIASTSPGIFIVNQSTSQGAILHSATYALVSAANPAKVGEVVLIYCTGLGAVNPTLASGTATPSNGTLYNAATVPTVSIGGSNAVVSFAGLAPGFVGLYQVNAVVPSITAGASVPVILTAGGVTSNTAIMPVSQ